MPYANKLLCLCKETFVFSGLSRSKQHERGAMCEAVLPEGGRRSVTLYTRGHSVTQPIV